jgi:hypothetical protein
MKDRELTTVVSPHVESIREICEEFGAPFSRIACTGSTTHRQRFAGNVGRVCVLLADDAPGWRSKDGSCTADKSTGRYAIKSRVRTLLEAAGICVAVRIQASYSELVQDEAGTVARTGANGTAIGVYA